MQAPSEFMMKSVGALAAAQLAFLPMTGALFSPEATDCHLGTAQCLTIRSYSSAPAAQSSGPVHARRLHLLYNK